MEDKKTVDLKDRNLRDDLEMVRVRRAKGGYGGLFVGVWRGSLVCAVR